MRMNFFNDDSAIYVEAFSVEEESGYSDVFCHGEEKSVQIYYEHVMRILDADGFAAFLSGLPNYHREDIRLVSCSAGKGDRPIAQDISRTLGIRVKAPDDDIYIIPEKGIVYIGSSYRNIGKWRLFDKGLEVV